MSKHIGLAGGVDRGQMAASPGDIPALGWWDIGRRTIARSGKNGILLVAAGVTFYGLLAIVPALAAFMTFYGLFFEPGEIEPVATLHGPKSSGPGLIRQVLILIYATSEHALPRRVLRELPIGRPVPITWPRHEGFHRRSIGPPKGVQFSKLDDPDAGDLNSRVLRVQVWH